MKFCTAFAVTLLLVGQVGAATLNITATPTAINPTTFEALDPQPDLLRPQPGPVTLQVDIAFEISDLESGERNFANTAFDIQLGPGLGDLFGWSPSAEMFEAGPPGPAGNLAAWATNLDAGASATDLQGILASIAGGLDAGDPRSSLGSGGPTAIGQLFLEWDGQTQSSFNLANVAFSVVGDDGLFAPSSQVGGPGFALGVPEPTSLMLAGLGLIGLVARRRRS